MAFFVATSNDLENDSTLIGGYLVIKESEILPVLKSKIPISYSSLDLFYRLSERVYKLFLSDRKVDFLNNGMSF